MNNPVLDEIRRRLADIFTPPDHMGWAVAHARASLAIEELRKIVRNEDWQTRKAINCCAAYLKRADKLFTKRG